MWDMCQMLNIWHISHTKPNLSPFSRCEIWYIFCNIEQYCDKFATVRNACGILFILCLFLFLSHISFIFSFSNSSPPPSPFSHTLSSSLSLLLYSLPIHEYEPPSISSLPSLIYILHRFFFSPFVHSLLSVLGVGLVVGLGCGCDFRLWVWLWVWLWFSIVIGVGIGLWVVGLSSLFYIPVNWPSLFVSSESRLFESILGTRTLWVDFRFRERGPGEICARESRQE